MTAAAHAANHPHAANPARNTYESPLAGRYAAAAMRELFGQQKRFSTWRRVWLALAEAEHELGLAQITPAALAELRAHLDDINFEAAEKREKEVRHDVMAHVHAFGLQCPAAAGIIHLGATSCDITDNADLIILRDGLRLLDAKLLGVMASLAKFARANADVPCLGSTHFQVAQLTTVGKRACLWLADLAECREEVRHLADTIPLRGIKGTTGTQASFLALFGGDTPAAHAKVRDLEARVAKKLGFAECCPVTGQTYSRRMDHTVLSALAGIGVSLHKFGDDMRLLMGAGELEEPFEEKQIGSSAMAYKRNPMRSERMCSLSRLLFSFADQAAQMASQQWLERTLDDSASRRVILPEAFLTADIVLSLASNISSGIVVRRATIAHRVAQQLPFMATEEIIMEHSRHGGNRQAAHEAIREASQAVVTAMREHGAANDLFDRLKTSPEFRDLGPFMDSLTDSSRFVGRAPQQVREFLAEHIDPVLAAAGSGVSGDKVDV
jgi:adenylosuccinate lyase